MTPRRHTNGASRKAGLLLAVIVAAFGGAFGGAGLPAGAEPGDVETLAIPYCPGSLEKVDVDYLDDDFVLPQALSIDEGTLPQNRVATFDLYGITYQTRLYYLTRFYWYPWLDLRSGDIVRKRGIRVKAKAASGSRNVAGTIQLVPLDSGRSVIAYRPKRSSTVERTAILTFTYLCRPHLETAFTLKIPAGL